MSTIVVIDIAQGTQIVRSLTQNELEQIEKDKVAAQLSETALKSRMNQELAAKESAKAKLATLGLTDAEIAALAG